MSFSSEMLCPRSHVTMTQCTYVSAFNVTSNQQLQKLRGAALLLQINLIVLQCCSLCQPLTLQANMVQQAV